MQLFASTGFLMINEDNASYYKFTRLQRLDKAIHTLEGMLTGMAADGQITTHELRVLNAWVEDHLEFAHKHPFNEVIPPLREALKDSQLDRGEHEDLLWLCSKLTGEGEYFDAITADMQRLHGLMAGISFDGEITVEELRSLQEWINEHEHLRRCWPYDEIDGLITSVLADGEISEEEHNELLGFFADFAHFTGQRAIALPDANNVTVRGVCAVTPEVVFQEKQFCFTGKSERLTRQKITGMIEELGGKLLSDVTQEIDYLVIGADGNPCWAYACYGRKVERAIRYRKSGFKLLLVHEYDFWDSVEDAR
jgi:hypothetical protein